MKTLHPKIVLTTLSLIFSINLVSSIRAHENSLIPFLKKYSLARETTLIEPETVIGQKICNLKVSLYDKLHRSKLSGLIRVTPLDQSKPLDLPGLFHRAQGWHTVTPSSTVLLPKVRVRIEAFHGLETEKSEQILNLFGKTNFELELPLHRIYDPSSRGLKSGNTHLHLMKISFLEAERYLQEVPMGDGLDLLFVSYLRRLPDEAHYTTNSFTREDLKRLSKNGIILGYGQEHRHNFGMLQERGYRQMEGYGHVMLLNLIKLIRPVSIGPGIMREGTDGRPLQLGIRKAREDGSTVVWCHNAQGFEDIPNWIAGLIDAQNIFDGGSGGYDDTFYRYLDLGLKVPFSTGTDWFIFDFSRVYIPLQEQTTERKWLNALTQGKSYITNGPFLEFEVDGRKSGDTLAMSAGKTVQIQGRGIGRQDFRSIELIVNGKVVHTVPSQPSGGHFVAEMDFLLSLSKSGWIALRIPQEQSNNELGRPLFAHTSPVYIQIADEKIFRPEVARVLITEMEESLKKIKSQGTFSNTRERGDVLQVYKQGIQILKKQLADS